MLNISQQTLHDFCRACLNKLHEQKKYNIHCLDIKLLQWLQDATIGKPSAIETFSNNICHLCRDKLEEILEFRKMCIQSCKTVMAILEKETQRSQEVETKEQKHLWDNNFSGNRDWLEFDFVIADKKDSSTIKSVAVCNKKELVLDEETEPSVENTLQPKVESLSSYNDDDDNDVKNKHDYNLQNKEENICDKFLSENESEYENHLNASDSSESEIEKDGIRPNKRSKTTNNSNNPTEIKTIKNKLNNRLKYKCDQCNRRCLNQQTLNNHLRTHQGLLPYQCPNCDRAFEKPTRLRDHINEVHNEEKVNIICEYEGCGKNFQRRRSYQDHYRRKHTQKKKELLSENESEYENPLNAADSSESEIEKDTNDSKNPKEIKTPKTTKNKPNNSLKYKCDQCNRRCLSQETLNNHLRTHQGLLPYQCPNCDRAFGKPTRLRDHISEVHNEEKVNIICEYEGCGKDFQRRRSYQEHYRRKHIQQKKPVVKSQQQHVCEDCGKIFTKLARLKEHQYTHKPKEEYPFQCTDCDKAFAKKDKFRDHQLRHAGVKNFECPYCGMKKTTKNELRTHLNFHTKERQWQCPRCPMVFNSAGNLRTHDQVVHQGLRRYACRFCEEAFGKPDSLKHHEMRHTGEKPHVCTECGKSFIQKVALKAHMKTHNKYLAKDPPDSSNVPGSII